MYVISFKANTKKRIKLVTTVSFLGYKVNDVKTSIRSQSYINKTRKLEI